MNLSEIQDLIKLVSRSSVSEVEIERKDFKITIKSEIKRRGKNQDGEGVQQIPVAIPQMAAMQQPVQQAMPQAAAPAPAQAPADSSANAGGGKEDIDDSKYITIKSPMIGTFYRSPSPDKDTFVNVGDDIKPGTVVCIIEAMKLFNEIESEISGKVVKVLVEDATPVEYDQPLFLVEPA